MNWDDTVLFFLRFNKHRSKDTRYQTYFQIQNHAVGLAEYDFIKDNEIEK